MLWLKLCQLAYCRRSEKDLEDHRVGARRKEEDCTEAKLSILVESDQESIDQHLI